MAKPAKTARPAMLLLVIAVTTGCREKSAKVFRTDRVTVPMHMQLPSVFGDNYPFKCSPVDDIGCQGVFAVRHEPVEDAGTVRGGSQAALLASGADSFRVRIASLKRAQKSIRIQALIFKGDESGLYIAELLKQKAGQGVSIKIIVDALSNLDWQTQWMYFNLKQHGIEVEGYEALYLQWLTAERKLTDPLRPNKRFHDKMWIIDAEDKQNRVAVVGGLNIANEYFQVDPTPQNRWRDQDMVVRGAIVADVQTAFDRNYAFFKSIKDKRPPGWNPDFYWNLSRATINKIVKYKYPAWKDSAVEDSLLSVLKQKVELDYQAVTARFLQSRPRMEETYIQQVYESLVDEARHSIQIANAYFVPSRRLMEKLRAAARRGVRVTIVTNSPETNDIKPLSIVSRHIYRELLRVNREPKSSPTPGLEIYEWLGAPFGEGTLHAKYAIFDGRAAVVGSYNLDPRSERLNSETALAFYDKPLVQRLEQLFVREYQGRSQKISWQQAVSFRNPKQLHKKFELLFALPLKSWL